MTRPCPKSTRVRTRWLPLVLAMVLLAGLASGPASRADVPRRLPDGCDARWASAARIGTLPGGLGEVSGFVSSARYPGVAWMIRDSQNPDSLYSFTLDGGRPRWREFPVQGTSNHDWEDVTYTSGSDGRGRLWILENDFANFGPASQRVYEVLEPDPGGDGRAELVASYRFDYPSGDLDTESIFALGGELYVVAKTIPNRVFRLARPLSSTGNRLVEVGHLDAESLLTAAFVSSDEQLLATVSVRDQVSVFAHAGGGMAGFLDVEPVFRKGMVDSQREAGDFFPHDSCDIVLISEDASVWRLSNSGSIAAAAPPPATAPDPVTGPGAPAPPVAPSAGPSGYWMVGADGHVHAFGDARELGHAPVGVAWAVDLEPAPSGDGYWVIDDEGHVFAFGDARGHGDVERGRLVAGERVTSLSATPSGKGYWVFTTRGRVLAFGDAELLGDMADTVLNGPVLDSVATPSGHGYYMVASDGGIFAFGDARFAGSMGGQALNAPVQSLVPDADGSGYWLVAADGGVFAFAAPFRGSMGGTPLNKPVTGMVPFGSGYLMVGEDGGIFNFSDRSFHGSLGSNPPASPIVAVAVLEEA